MEFAAQAYASSCLTKRGIAPPGGLIQLDKARKETTYAATKVEGYGKLLPGRDSICARVG